MAISVVGLNHQRAPIEVRERLAFCADEVSPAVERLAAETRVPELVLLSTCHRTEIYTTVSDPDIDGRRATDFLEGIARPRGEASDPVAPYAYELSGDEAIRHLFRVTSGLDALVLGEPEIVGQVSTALRAAGEAGTVSHRLSRLFHYALRTSRKVRRETEIARHSLSLSAIGVRLLDQALEDLSSARVLLVGVGETGQLAARALRRTGVDALTVTSRRPGRAAEAAEQLDARSIPMSEIGQAMADIDVIISCTSAQEPVITAADVRAAMDERTSNPLFILDLTIMLRIGGLEHLHSVQQHTQGEQPRIAC